jgi:predicted lipid-binding transport protein (Tim44 family)
MTPHENFLRALRHAVIAVAVAATSFAPATALAGPGASAAISPRALSGAEARPGTLPGRGPEIALAEPRAFLPPAAALAAPTRDFSAGLLGGLAGTGVAAIVLGRPALAGLDGSFASFLGLGLQLLLLLTVAALGFVVLRRLPRIAMPGLAGPLASGYAPALPSGPGFSDRLGPRFAPRGGSARPPAAGTAPVLNAADFQAFERALKDIKAAWSRQDIPALQGLCSPEMVQSFADQLARLATRGLRNKLSDVTLEQGDLAETWTEGDRQFATVALRFSLVDCTRDARSNKVMGGDAVRRRQVTEVWTFARSRGGRWSLTAVQGVN